jgi:lipopolysaccharide biosynthesis glycosyltransferase
VKTVPILFTFDQSLLMPAGVCLTSLLESADADTFYDIFILHGPGCDFSALDVLKERFGNFRMTVREVSGEFVGAYEVRGIPETAYYRLLSPELIPQYDRLLYSDVDVIIREDLSKYYELDLGDNYFAAVDNCSRLRPAVQDYISTLGIDWRNNYYYSGNLVINSALIRRDHMIDKFRELGKNAYDQQDMDIINIACNQRFLPLGPVFCLSVQLYSLIVNRRTEMDAIYGHQELDDALDHGIVHFNGVKPWKGACMNMDIWWTVYRRSQFFDEAFCQRFWDGQMTLLERLPFLKRVKMVLRYPIDRKKFKK